MAKTPLHSVKTGLYRLVFVVEFVIPGAAETQPQAVFVIEEEFFFGIKAEPAFNRKVVVMAGFQAAVVNAALVKAGRR